MIAHRSISANCRAEFEIGGLGGSPMERPGAYEAATTWLKLVWSCRQCSVTAAFASMHVWCRLSSCFNAT